MKETLQKLRAQPDGTKTKLALFGALVVTAGIIAIWIMMLPKTLANEENDDTEKAPSPIRALIDSVSNASKSIPKPIKSPAQPEVTSSETSSGGTYDESNPASSGDVYQGEQVYTEE